MVSVLLLKVSVLVLLFMVSVFVLVLRLLVLTTRLHKTWGKRVLIFGPKIH